MKVEKRDSRDEKRVVTAMIVDKSVLGTIAQKWATLEFRSKWANLVGDWCVDFYNRYEDAPGKAIQGIFEAWASNAKDEATVELTARFLQTISDEYETLKQETNSSYTLDVAGRHFETVQIERLKNELQGDLDAGDVERARKRLASCHKIEMGVGAGIDVLLDKEAIKMGFESKGEKLIRLSGDAGRFFAAEDTLERDCFVAIMATEKRGKSWALINLSWLAMTQRCKVAFFAVGDMSQNQMMRRFMVRAAKRPMRAKSIRFPVSIQRDPDERYASVEFEDREFTDTLDWQKAWKAVKKVQRQQVRSRESFLRLSCHPTSSINVGGIRSILQSWEFQGWVPDVIVVDYADILANPYGFEGRDGINETWKQLRRLSLENHCLVITATQAKASAYTADTLTMEHFSEDKRKFAHVTAMIGLNADAEEQRNGIQRLNYLVLREDEFQVWRCVHVAGCLDIGNPWIKSTF